MTKYVPKKLTQLSANESAAVDIINQNFDSIKEHIDDTLSRTAKAPSQMQAALDMNGQKIINIGAPTQDTDLVRQKDVVADKEEIKQLVNTASIAVEKAMEAAETAEEAAEDMSDQIQLAKDWATKTSGPVADEEYSSKYYAEQIGADVHTVADIAEDVTTVASNATNINTVASDISNVNAVAGDLANIDSVASNETDIDTVATNISDVNDCADNMAAIQGAPAAAESAAASAEQAAQSAAVSNPPPLLSHMWADHLLNDIRYLRADTFSWQSGLVYKAAYDHLFKDVGYVRYMIPDDDLQIKFYRAPAEDTEMYAWTNQFSTLYTVSEFPQNGDDFYYHNQVFGTVLSTGSELGSDAVTPTTETVGSYTITYYPCADGHKIVEADQETTVQNIYNESGVAWYYILDTANQKFKLPRELPITDKSKGNGNPISFVNVKDTGVVIPSGEYYLQEDSGDARVNSGTTNNLRTMGLNSNSTKSSIISHRANENGQQYLYFYVGNYSQSATEQTAGLNSELFNGKVDLNLANIDNTNNAAANNLNTKGIRTVVDSYAGSAGNDYYWYRIWSDGWVEQGGILHRTAEGIVTYYYPVPLTSTKTFNGIVGSFFSSTLTNTHLVTVDGVYDDRFDKYMDVNFPYFWWEAKGYKQGA